jgi:hypothetical protein
MIRPNAAHVLLDRALADLDAELEQLAADALRAPQTITLGHIAYQVDGVGVDACAIPGLGPVPPEQAKAGPMPFENRLGLHDNDGPPPCRQQGGADEQSKPIGQSQTWTAAGPPEHAELVTESGIFNDEFTSGTVAKVGNDLDRFNPVPERGKVGPETADSSKDRCGDRSRGAVGPRSW